MSHYDKLTVVEIRAEFKARGIPATGLTRKQQLIDRLLEVDAETQQKKEATQAEGDVSIVDQSVSAQDNVGDAEEASEHEHASPVATQGEGKETMNTDVKHASKPSEDEREQSLPRQTSTSVIENTTEQPQSTTTKPSHDTDMPADVISNSAAALEQQINDTRTEASPKPAAVVVEESEENRKRKRRSLTPDVQEEEVAQKRRKSSEGIKENVTHIKNIEIDSNKAQPTDATGEAQVDAEFTKTEEPEVMDTKEDAQNESPRSIKAQSEQQAPQSSPAAAKTHVRSPKDTRYKDILSAPLATLDGASDYPPQDRYISPSLHPATSALYIRNLKRPLQPQALKSHLESLAQPPTNTSPIAPIKVFHLDTLRTHALILFTSPAAAARVRAALHESIWPPEPTREPLWVDFVPEESVTGWIDLELNSSGGGRSAGAKRWEVVYEEDEARFQEVGGSAMPPSGPRASFAQHTAPPPRIPTPEVQHVAEAAKPAPFLALDSLFKSTTAKPKLYFLPVAADLADKRLDELDSRTTRRGEVPPGGSGYRDSRRYTFEDGGLVDGGPEFGLRVERGGQGMRGGRGGRGGGWRGR